MAEQTQKPVVRFGVFEASLPSGELRKHGLLIRVHRQPFKILAILLERAVSSAGPEAAVEPPLGPASALSAALPGATVSDDAALGLAR